MSPPAGGESLNVVALISGGKDSFFSLLHCRAQGHRVVALANLYPSPPPAPAQDAETETETETDTDLNSFMYQTVGHEVIPLYSQATGLPLYRQEILGRTGGGGRDYSFTGDDETESMIPLLQKVLADHPEVNALCAGAILSTYQRTRVESVALRLGLTPLAYLWKYPVLPLPDGRLGGDDGQLLRDMAAAGLEARVIKVASGGLDEEFLWEDVASVRGVERLERAMRRFGGAVPGSGAVIGEGGEFETLVVDGPGELFGSRVVVEEGDRRVVREGGGTAWLRVDKARVEEKGEGEGVEGGGVRIPDLWDGRFSGVLQALESDDEGSEASLVSTSEEGQFKRCTSNGQPTLRQWCVVGDVRSRSSIQAETTSVIEKVTALLHEASLPATSIISTVIALRQMSDFPTINKIYGSLFTQPNPPSRVTISCGDLLPPGCNIAVYLSVHYQLAPTERQGLHVQSRSYWAPANIGPYSQAISIPISSLSSNDSGSPAQLVHIAGQIPLIPATMNLPDPSESFSFSAALALQHLWRIGTETGVQWWSSAVAYLPHTPDEPVSTTKEKALRASRIWRAAHTWSPEDADDDEAGPDLWDRTHNPAYMSFAEGAEAKTKSLPDLSVLAGDESSIAPPAFFAAEVQELPRGAGIEWHAHLGLAHLADDSDSVRVISLDSEMMQAQHTLVTLVTDENQGGVFVHTLLAVKKLQGQDQTMPAATVLAELHTLYLARIAALADVETAQGIGGEVVAPAHLYMHAGVVEVAETDVGREGCPLIPCYSLWNGEGEEVVAVAVYQTWLERR
ncbi:meiotically up-regulated 71 protein [Coniochaeta sp. 2T2.1]|nr:meiotically up-regulated 71 protein [Coniochaeta sp. 2T2.1]